MLPKTRTTKINTTTTLRRNAALLCAALTGLGLAGIGQAAHAAPTGPTVATSPPTPTPFQSPLYHSGGAPTYPAGTTSPTPYPVAAAAATAAPYLTPLIDPLQGQLQGTPTEVYNGSITQIPSYELGNYDPTLPPGGLAGGPGGVNTYFPNHFGDGGIYSWSAPFSYLSQTGTAVTVDDSLTTTPAPGVSSFTNTGGWASVANATTDPAAGTATDGEYLRLPPNTAGTATWTLYQPTAGSYSVYFHIPNDLPNSSGTPEVRDTQVVYAIAVHDAGGNVTATTTASASQTEANDSQFLAGPFTVAAGGSVVVTLTRSSTPVVINNNQNFLVADSMTLQQTVGDVQSAPTVITSDLYPADFTSTTHPLQYWGVFVPLTASSPIAGQQPQQTGGTTIAANANPDTTGAASPETAASFNSGTVVLKTGSITTFPAAATPTLDLRRIRQLVYFGRSDPAASVSSSVDDSAGAPAFRGNGILVQNTAGVPNLSAATASSNEYLRINAGAGSAPTITSPPAATWIVPVPAAGPGTTFFAYAHIPANLTTPAETRLSQVYYSVTTSAGTYGPVAISQKTQGTDALVALPTGPLTAAAGSSITIRLYSTNTTSTNNAVVVADSVTVSTGSGQGAIYCVDGFTGGVVWRYETPGAANGPSSPVFASPVITKINVLVTPAVGAVPAVYANRLVAIVGDNNGQVYCLDAIGNGDGTSNADVVNAATGAPITIPQPAYGGLYGAVGTTPVAAGVPAATAAATAHVGTTGTYWIYRPDASRPKYIAGGSIGAIKTPDPTTDLPVPAAFGTASPNVFVDPTVSTTPDASTGALKSNATVYIGNSNGVLYALNALGAGIDGTTSATYTASGDAFNVSQMGTGFDVPTGAAANSFPLTAVVPTPQPLWWFSLRGVNPNSGDNASSADIESAPAIYVNVTPPTGAVATDTFTPTVYIGSAHEMETTSNVGRLYALNGLYGPSGNNGRSPSDPAATGHALPGSFNYNVGQRPQINPADTADWSFPDAVGKDAYTTHSQSSSGKPRPALGNITGSPVVFTDTDENIANQNADGSLRQTRIYFAAGSGYEATTDGKLPNARPDEGTTGRLWAVNLDGSVGTTTSAAATTRPTAAPTPTTGQHIWSYPLANDPNDAAKDTTPEPGAPMGAFVRATPAIGFVQFPSTIINGDAAGTAYNPVDAVHTGGIDGQSVPMLYVGTAGVSDTALYAVDIDGDLLPLPATPAYTSSGTITTDQRTIYRVISPDGSIFQSSPALVANASSAGGNGGGVYAVAGNTLYDYQATPVSNPFYSPINGPQPYPLIRENAAFAGFGPISSPAVAGANTTDLSLNFINGVVTPGSLASTNTSSFSTNTTDWVYVGDSSTGLCRGITPNDTGYGGIAVGLGQIVPPDVNAPGTYNQDAIEQAFLVDPTKVSPPQNSHSTADAQQIGVNAPLQIFEWGDSVYVRFTNAVPPNPPTAANPHGDPALYVYDHQKYRTAASSSNIVPYYTSDGSQAQSIQFQVSNATTSTVQGQGKFLNQQILTAAPYMDGYVVDAAGTPPASFQDVTTNLATTGETRYLGAYTYSIGDGSAAGVDNTPGARRRFQGVKQLVTVYNFDGTNYTPAGTTIIGGDATAENLVSQYNPTTGRYGFTPTSKIAAVDQPTFGILNPLGVRGGGVNLLNPNSAAVPIGDTLHNELGPFRSAQPAPTLTTATAANGTTSTTKSSGGDSYTLQALTNGNDVPIAAPPSSSGSGLSPIVRPEGVLDPTGASTPTMTNIVVTTTGEIAHNTTGDNREASTGSVTGQYNNSITTDGLNVTTFGGYALDVFDRSSLYTLGQNLRLKMTVPANVAYSPPSGKDGLYWNSNFTDANGTNPDTTGHDSVVNFLPWETPPVAYSVGVGSMTNGSQDYPNITPGNITQNASAVSNQAAVPVANSGGDLTSNSVTLTPAYGTTTQNRVVTADPVQIQLAIPHYQPPNQQLYQQTSGTAYSTASTNQIAPVNSSNGSSNITLPQVFPMGYITTKRVYVPDARGFYNRQRPYRDVRIYTGVLVDMRTSVADNSAVRDIGKVPAAFGVQTENDPQYGLFMPYNPAFQPYFKPLEVHNDGNINLLNVHFDQKYINTLTGQGNSLFLSSDTVDPLSFLDGYDVNSITGPKNSSEQRLSASGTTIPLTGTLVPEQPYLIRTSIDTDLAQAYGRNPGIAANYQFSSEPTGANISAMYPSATFHKPIPGGSQPSTLMVPDAPERYVANASPEAGTNFQVSPRGNPILPTGSTGVTYQAPPLVSLAMPFGTPVGTYSTPGASDPLSVRLFEGLDLPSATNKGTVYVPNSTNLVQTLYPPQYGGAIGGVGTVTSQPTDTFQLGQPLSTSGTQLIGHVLEQRLTDGATYGAVPMIDAGPAGSATPQGGTAPVAVSTPDFAPAAFCDPSTGDLSVYWTTGRTGSFGIFGANLPFTPNSNTPGVGYFLPNTPPTAANPTGEWWTMFTPTLATGTNSGLTIAGDPPVFNTNTKLYAYPNPANFYAFSVDVNSTAPYSNTLYSYSVTPGSGAVTGNGLPVTTDSAQVKYGIKGLSTRGSGFTNNLWAFWTGSTRGRTALYYNSLGANGTWIPAAPAPSTVGLLPVPAGLTAVADASPLLMPLAPVNGTPAPVIEVTYSGTAPSGNIDLYASRYAPDSKTPSQLDLVAFPPVTENLLAIGGWYQARDVAWSRTGALNVSLLYTNASGIQNPLLLYNAANVPQFTKAIYDKASGLLVLTGVHVPYVTPPAAPAPQFTVNTVYVDAATGRVRFSPALLTTQSFTQIRATFSPEAKRLTTDSRADTAPTTFLDLTLKPNDTPSYFTNTNLGSNVEADRRWTIWRKSGVSGAAGSASLYYKTQRLTFFLPYPINVTATAAAAPGTGYTYQANISSVTVNGTDVTRQVDVDYSRGRIYFPISTGAEGQTVAVTYTPLGTTTPVTTQTDPANTVQWQDETIANDPNAVPYTNSIDALAVSAVNPGYGVPIDTAVNENNVVAFLDPFAGTTTTIGGNSVVTGSHKVWLFWNSTRNGTADIYSETIDPRFVPIVTTP